MSYVSSVDILGIFVSNFWVLVLCSVYRAYFQGCGGVGEHIFLQQNRQIDRGEYINRSQTQQCGNWDGGRAIPFLGIFVSNFLYWFFLAVYTGPIFRGVVVSGSPGSGKTAIILHLVEQSSFGKGEGLFQGKRQYFFQSHLSLALSLSLPLSLFCYKSWVVQILQIWKTHGSETLLPSHLFLAEKKNDKSVP
jgi:hypothetical protein